MALAFGAEVPGEGEEEDGDEGAAEDGGEGDIPTVFFHEPGDAFVLHDATDVAEHADEAGGGADGFFGGEVERHDAEHHHGDVNEEADDGEEDEVEPEHAGRGPDESAKR